MMAFSSTQRALWRALAIAVLIAPAWAWAEESDDSIAIEKDDWSVAIGVASFSVPRYSGDNDSESLIVPNLELRYKDRLELSFLTGLTYDFLNRGAWSAGPALDYEFGRDTNPELIGFEEVHGGVEVGGYFEYKKNDVTAKVKLLTGVGGHEGTSIKATLRHAKLYDTGLIPLYFLIGPAFRFGDAEYLNTFYGVNQAQAEVSGLPVTSLPTGVISFGLDAVLVVPLSRKVFIRNFFLLEFLSNDVARSPIVTNQGDAVQPTLGIELGYFF